MREDLISAGYEEAGAGEKAGICVINTCTVTAKADRDSLSIIRRAALDNPGAFILVTGCLAEMDEERIRKAGGVSVILKNDCKKRILEFIPASPSGRVYGGISFFRGRSRAFLKIQDGCDNRCSYCKVSLVRGRARSRDGQEVVEEACRLAANGYREIVLTGICLGSYGRDKAASGSLPGLLKRLSRTDGIVRIRLSSIEMSDISAELLELFAAGGKLCPHFHVPLQSGDDRILAAMRRRYDSRGFLDRVNEIKKKVPGVSVTTDVIAGFPGEDEEAFSNTLRTLKEMRPLRTHIFPFSPRKGTAAAEIPGQPSRETINRRRHVLSALAHECAREYMADFIDREAEIMPENTVPFRDNSGVLVEGYSANYIRVIVHCKGAVPNAGTVLGVRLKEMIDDGMRAEPL